MDFGDVLDQPPYLEKGEVGGYWQSCSFFVVGAMGQGKFIADLFGTTIAPHYGIIVRFSCGIPTYNGFSLICDPQTFDLFDLKLKGEFLGLSDNSLHGELNILNDLIWIMLEKSLRRGDLLVFDDFLGD